MSLSLKIWTSPKTGEVRVYINAFHEWHASPTAPLSRARAYVIEGEDGLCKIGGFAPSWSGEFGHAAQAGFEVLGLQGMRFTDLLARIAECVTKSGNFSEAKYFKAAA